MKSARPDSYLHIGWFPLPEVQEVAVANAPAFLQGLCALFVSDVHLRKSATDEQLRSLIALIRAQNADLILFGGDYAEGAGQHARFFEAFAGVQARLGCFGVMGNNDREAFPDADLLRRMAEKAGMQLLLNESIRLENGLCIGGCDDHKHGRPQTQHLFGEAPYRILLSHFPVKPDCEAELMLSGHTHGGQFNFLGLTPYAIGFERSFGIEAAKGLHQMGKRRLLVSEGIGMSRLPLRMGVKPRIHLVKFTG